MLMYNQIIEEVKKVKGYFNDERLLTALFPLVINLDPGSVIVEIGTFNGQSTRFFSLVNPNVKIFTMDITGFEGSDGIEPEVLKGGDIVFVKGASSELVKGFNWKVDLLFIDGSHEYGDVKKDLENWTPLVKSGGFLLCHDFNFEGVEKAVKEWKEKNVNSWLFDDPRFSDIINANAFIARKI